MLLDDLSVGLLTTAFGATAAGIYAVGVFTDSPYPQLLGLRRVAEWALNRGELSTSEARVRKLLTLAEQYRGDWYYGNAVHHAHLLLGEIALARGDRNLATAELLAAGHTPGSPQLTSFGPNMRLAAALLRLGIAEPVLEYLVQCRRFWTLGAAKVDQWSSDIRAGREPRFGANLVY